MVCNGAQRCVAVRKTVCNGLLPLQAVTSRYRPLRSVTGYHTPAAFISRKARLKPGMVIFSMSGDSLMHGRAPISTIL